MIGEVATYLPWLTWPMVLVVSEILDAIYSGMESGIYVMNKLRLDLRAEEGFAAARTYQRLLRKPDNVLAVLLIGTNVMRYVATAAVSAMFFLAGYPDKAEWFTMLVATPILFIIGDAVPKGVFQRRRETAMYRLAWFLSISDKVFRWTGVSLLVRGVSLGLAKLVNPREKGTSTVHNRRVSTLLTEGRASGALTHFQTVMADNVINISEVTLADVMIPMRRVARIPAWSDREELLKRIRRHNFSRLPVTHEDGQVTGVLDILNVLLVPSDDLAAGLAPRAPDEPTQRPEPCTPLDRAAPPFVLQGDTSVTDAIYRMRQANQAMCIVADNNGKHIGVATMKDLVEEIVGELKEW